ncbi:MAG TPA: hypothetical protein VFE18_13015 [Phenylobacterium sp.]|jgi:hypothetical protein|uniref:hypothetical protein n=1 Tax=Phenylobacterium sp. TaxID=1871053 RepID=UPI002D3CAFD2|nr:hypothetical protein [Phenylobacterium sp.]HZZ69086.1 hypothetical protein [Phenylobacterium sp.]
MRVAVAVSAVLLATPAAAQPIAGRPFQALTFAHDADRSAAALAARNRDVALSAQLNLLQTEEQTDRALSNIAAGGVNPGVPTIPFNPKAPPPRIDPSQLAEMPDATLAASNARIRAAADNRK